MRWESQNPGTVGVGKDLWTSSSPTSLLRQSHREQVAQEHTQVGFKYLQRQRLHNLPGHRRCSQKETLTWISECQTLISAAGTNWKRPLILKHFTLAMTSKHPGSLPTSYNSTRAQSHPGLPFWPGLCVRCANLLPAGLTSLTSWTRHSRACLAESFMLLEGPRGERTKPVPSLPSAQTLQIQNQRGRIMPPQGLHHKI